MRPGQPPNPPIPCRFAETEKPFPPFIVNEPKDTIQYRTLFYHWPRLGMTCMYPRKSAKNIFNPIIKRIMVQTVFLTFSIHLRVSPSLNMLPFYPDHQPFRPSFLFPFLLPTSFPPLSRAFLRERGGQGVSASGPGHPHNPPIP